MQHHRTNMMIVTALALIAGVSTTPAAAAPRPDGADFSCRASAVRAGFPPYPVVQPPTIEPLIANGPESPCADGAAQIIGALTAGPAATDTLRVSTDVTPDHLSSSAAADGAAATASATVERVTITGLPMAITATMLTADAAFTCAAGRPVGTSSSRVASLTVGGVPVSIPPGDNVVVRLPPWDAGVLTLNQVIVEPTKITRRALFADFNGNTGLPDVAISEASVGLTGNPCAAAAATPPATTPPATTPPAATPAPAQARPQARARLATIPAPFIRYGLNRCIRSPFIARVVGVNIDHVTFTLDGQAKPKDSSSPFQMRINTRALRPAAHRLTARVVFRSATLASPRTLRFSFRRCAGIAGQPQFTG